MARARIPIPQIGGMRRRGTPTLLQPNPEGVTECHELVNTDADEPGRIQGRPAARAIHDAGVADVTSWPRNGAKVGI